MTQCPEINHNISIHYNNQSVSIGPCCQSTHTLVTDSILEHPRLIELRKINAQDLPLTSDCQGCSIIEKAQARSRRIAQLEFYQGWTGTGIRGLDLHLGNLCNLKCVICNPANSTSWVSDHQKLGLPVKSEWLYNKNNQFDLSWLDSLDQVEMVHMWGGEPFATPAHIKVLQILNNNHRLNHCRISYNTNGTFLPTIQAIELWQQARLVELYFSIDDIGARFEYQRTNAQWAQVVENLQWYYNMPTHNHLFYFTVTWSLLNVYYLPELIEWKKQMFNENRFGDGTQLILNRATGPCEIKSIPEVAYTALVQKFRAYPELQFIIDLIQVGPVNDRSIDYIQQLDQIRNTQYQHTHPEWAKLLGI